MPKQKVLTIIGLGKTGFSFVKFLHAQGHHIFVTDTRDNPPYLLAMRDQYPDILFQGGELSAEFIDKADEILVSPGISIKHPLIIAAAEKGVPIVGDVELFARHAKAPIVAITGSNGKTTVTTLMGLMIEKAGSNVFVCGNIGEPVLDILEKPTPDFYVIELSSFQLETTDSLKAKAAVVLNITPDHMDRYDTFELYCAAKRKIYQGCENAIINLDDPVSWAGALDNQSSQLSFTLKKPQKNEFGIIQKNNQSYLAFGETELMPTHEMKLHGQHHNQNALACLALGHAIGLDFPPMLQILREFSGLTHRCELIAEKKGVQWYNDSKATNVGAALAAIETLGQSTGRKMILILGGDAKNADLQDLKAPVLKYASHVLLLGKDAPRFVELLRGHLPLTMVSTLEEAVEKASEIASKNEIVLLSPACASLDMFTNYEHRGKVFVQAVEALV